MWSSASVCSTSKDANMTTEKFRQMMRHKVYPAIVQHYSGIVGRVIVQLDNARPHVGKNTIEQLNDDFNMYKRQRTQGVAVRAQSRIPDVPDVIVTTQSAQSPDCNLCDLAFFSASSVRVRKRRRVEGRGFDVDKLEDDVEKVFNQYPVESLCKMWNTKARVLQKIVYAKGGNDYKLHGDVVAPHTRGVPKWKFKLYDVGK